MQAKIHYIFWLSLAQTFLLMCVKIEFLYKKIDSCINNDYINVVILYMWHLHTFLKNTINFDFEPKIFLAFGGI